MTISEYLAVASKRIDAQARAVRVMVRASAPRPKRKQNTPVASSAPAATAAVASTPLPPPAVALFAPTPGGALRGPTRPSAIEREKPGDARGLVRLAPGTSASRPRAAPGGRMWVPRHLIDHSDDRAWRRETYP